MSERIRDLVDVLKNNLGEGKSCLDELSVYVAVIQ